MKIEKHWVISFVIICIISLGALVGSNTDQINMQNFLPESNINSADTAWILTASGLVLLMTPGLSFFYGGMVGRKNILSTMLQSFISLGVVSLIWIAVGFSLSFGDSLGFEINGIKYGIIGNPFEYFSLMV